MCRIMRVLPPACLHLSCSVWPPPCAAAPSLQSSRPASSLQPAMALLTPCSSWGFYEYGSIQHSSHILSHACAPCTPHNPPHPSHTTLLPCSDTVFRFPSLPRLPMEAFPLLPSQFFKAAQPTQVFPVLFYQKTSLVYKWLKYSIPPTFFWIFYYLVVMVPKACGGWLAFCPLVFAAQTHLSLHRPCSPKYMTWGSYEMLPSWTRAPPWPDQGTGQWLLHCTKSEEERWKLGS